MSYGVNSFGVNSFGLNIADSGGPADTHLVAIANSQQVNVASTAAINSWNNARPTVDVAIAVIGQSNASGRGSGNQTAPGSGAWLYTNDGQFVTLSDPWDRSPNTYAALDDGASAAGSYIPRIAIDYNAIGKTTLWLPANKGDTTALGWQRNLSTSSLYGAMKERIDAAGGVDKIVIHLGESDAMNGTPQATFVTRMNQLVADLIADFGCAVYLQKIHTFSGYATGCATIRAAISEVWNGTSGVKRGADLDGITTNVHFTTTADLNAVADRTFSAIAAVESTVANSQQVNTSSAAAIRQTHQLTIASSQQANQATSAAIRQTHRISAANSQQANTGVAGSISQSSITFVAAADSIQINQADAAAIRQTHLIGVASSQQINTAAAAAIAQTASGSILIADSQQINQASAGSILQMHLVSVADSQQINRASSGRVSDGTQPIGATVASLIASVRPATRLGVAVSPVNALLREVDLSNFYYKGGSVRLHVRVAGDGDADFDPAVLALKTRFDSGQVTVLTYGIDPEIVRDRIGRYHADLDLLGAGTFHFRWETTAPAGAAEGKIPVAAGRFS